MVFTDHTHILVSNDLVSGPKVKMCIIANTAKLDEGFSLEIILLNFTKNMRQTSVN